MRKCVAIYGATNEALQLVAVLEANPDLEIAIVFDPDLESARGRIEALDPDTAKRLLARLSDDRSVFEAGGGIHAVIDAGLDPAVRPAGTGRDPTRRADRLSAHREAALGIRRLGDGPEGGASPGPARDRRVRQPHHRR